jgi:hypothetical protein
MPHWAPLCLYLACCRCWLACSGPTRFAVSAPREYSGILSLMLQIAHRISTPFCFRKCRLQLSHANCKDCIYRSTSGGMFSICYTTTVAGC